MSNNPQAGTATEPDFIDDEDGADAIDSLMDDVPEDQQQNAAPAPGEDDEQDQAETDDQTDDQPQEPQAIRLADGSEANLEQIEEWRRGSMLQADYTRKTQEHAETVRRHEAVVAAHNTRSQQLEQTLQAAFYAMQSVMPAQPDIHVLHEDPILYQQQKALYDLAVGKLQESYGRLQQFNTQKVQQDQDNFRTWAEGERNLAQQKIPELRDPVKANELRNQFVKWAPHYGFTPQDIAQVWDHRTIMIARDAIRYRELMAKKPKPNQPRRNGPQAAPAVQRPGPRNTPGAGNARKLNEKLSRLKQTGSRDAGAAVIEDILGTG